MTYTYKIVLRNEPEGGFTVLVPALPGCITFGETLPEAMEMAKEAISLYVESLQARGEPIPSEEGNLEASVTIEAHG